MKNFNRGCAFAICLGFLASSVLAEGTAFKRITPGAAKPGKMITIHIQPQEPEKPILGHSVSIDGQPKAKPTTTRPSGSQTAEWFWSKLGIGVKDASPSRLNQAVAVLQQNPSEAEALSPGRARMEAMAKQHGHDILKSAAGHAVSPAMVLAVMAVESAGVSTAKSPAGAVGLMQLMAPTAARFGVTDREDPAQSIAGGAEYLAWLAEEFKGDPLLALAGYNAGEGAVAKNGGIPPYAETRAYVPKVVAAWNIARMLCLQPPVKFSDGCIFNTLTVAGR